MGKLLSFLCVLGLLMGCSGSEKRADQSARSKSEISLTIDGKPVTLKVKEMSVYLVDEGELPPGTTYPETFDVSGDQGVLAGEIPKELEITYGDHWEKLKGHDVAIMQTGGGEGKEMESKLTLTEIGECVVTEGTLHFESVGESYDARVPLTGKIKLKLQTPNGEKTAEGTFDFLGVTWG